MIQANELRLGNYYQWDGEGKFLQISIEQLQKLLIGTTRIKPVPITEEWLLKLGFINDDAQRYFKNGIYLILYDEGCTILHNQIHINYFYVHQLQNLYFAVTGEELILSVT